MGGVRRWRYGCAAVVGVLVGAFFGLMALASRLCETWGEQCSSDELAQIKRLWAMAVLAPFAFVGLYALVERRVAAGPPPPVPERRYFRFGPVERRGPVDGWVVAWHEDRGWGVLASPEVDGEVWVHEDDVGNSVRRPLTVGRAVRFGVGTPGRHGYPYQATWVTGR